MAKLKAYPKNLGRLDHEIQTLRKQAEAEKANLELVGRAVAQIHLDCLARSLTFMHQLDLVLCGELFLSELTFEENVPRAAAGLRMLGELTKIAVAHIDGFLKCFGGPETIGIQQLQRWAEGNPVRQEFLLKYLTRAVALAEKTHKKKRNRERSNLA